MATIAQAYDALRTFALTMPEAWEDFPWDHSAIKVRKKVFVFLGNPVAPWGISLKLPDSAVDALELPFTAPTGYGLGKSGWVSCTFEEGHDVDVGMLLAWIEESYRAVAPKTLVKRWMAEQG